MLKSKHPISGPRHTSKVLKQMHVDTMMRFPREYPYKLRRLARRRKGIQIFYVNKKSQQMFLKKVVKDPRLIILVEHYFKVKQKIEKTDHEKAEMLEILQKSKILREYEEVFCLTQIRAHYTCLENKLYILRKESNKMLELIKEIDFNFYKSFTAEALYPIAEH